MSAMQTASSATNSIITTLGAGSGINMAQLASDLATAQFQARSSRLNARGEQLAAQISSASSIRSGLSMLASSLGERMRSGDLASRPVLANGAVAQAIAPPGSVGRGPHTLEVSQLAAGQTHAGPAMASGSAAVGGGTITFRFGTLGQGSFAADPARAPLEIAIASGASLADIARSINGARAGLQAYVAQSVDGARLVVKGAEGAANGFVIEAAPLAGEPGLAALAWEPAGGNPAQLLASARDALFTFDGLAMRTPSNQTGPVAPGIALTLTATNPGAPTRITFANPAEAITGTMQDLVGALNEIAGELAKAMNIENGELRADPGARALRQQLSGLAGQTVMASAPADAPRTLGDLGLAVQRDGTFRLDNARLAATLERDPARAAAMFTTGLFGVFATIDRIAREAGAANNPGSLGGSVARLQRQASRVSEQAADLAERQEALRSQLLNRFARADTRIAASQSTLGFLQQQIDAWNAGRQ